MNTKETEAYLFLIQEGKLHQQEGRYEDASRVFHIVRSNFADTEKDRFGYSILITQCELAKGECEKAEETIRVAVSKLVDCDMIEKMGQAYDLWREALEEIAKEEKHGPTGDGAGAGEG